MRRKIDWRTATADRYARLRLIEWWDQEAVSRASVMVVGCGALGSEVTRLLTLVGVGRIVVVDPDRIELHNLTRGVFFRSSDVGRFKAAVTARRAQAMNPDVEVVPIVGLIETHVGLGFLRTMSVLACCVDSIGARVAVSRMCYRAGVPWVNGGISPTAGEVTAFAASEPPCYVCTVSNEMWEREQVAHTCRGFRAVGTDRPVATTATAASVVAAYQVQQILTWLSPSDAAPRCLDHGQRAFFSLTPPSCMVSSIVPDPDCDSHERWESNVTVGGSPDTVTAQDVLQASGLEDGVLELGREVVLRVQYPCCKHSRRVGRPLKLCTEEMLRCPKCGGETGEPTLIHEIRRTDRLAAKPLSAFGVPPRDILRVVPRNGGQPRYVAIG